MMNCLKALSIGLAVLAVSTAVQAETITLDGTSMSFAPPNGFEPVPQHIIDLKWSGENAPRFVVGNKGATTTVAYDVKPYDIREFDMDELLAVFEEGFEASVPGVAWIQKEVVTFKGQEWLFLEMTSTAIDTDIHNIILVTSHGTQMVIFNFNSTRKEFSLYEQSLRTSIESISIGDN